MDIITEVARETLSFMAGRQIPLTPFNYQRYFYTFWAVKHSKKEFTPDQIIKMAEAIGRRVSLDQAVKEFRSRLEETETFFMESLGKLRKGRNDTIGMLIQITEEAIQFIEKQKKVVKIMEKTLKEKTVEAMQDYLTGLYNRRTFEQDVQNFIRKREPFVLILFDLDDFKKVNDSFGHIFGDRVLKEFARILENYPSPDLLKYRVGGEEFAVLMKGEGVEEGVKIGNRIRQVWENRRFTVEGKIYRFTVSGGVAQYRGEEVSPEEGFWQVYEEADTQLYTAKEKGKNMIAYRINTHV